MNFYREFIPFFAKITLPITELLKMRRGGEKPWPLNWMMECQAAFEKLKGLFAAELDIKHPDPEEPFVIQADASEVAMGAVLQQIKEWNLLPYAYMSRNLNETERWLAVWDKEAFTV